MSLARTLRPQLPIPWAEVNLAGEVTFRPEGGVLRHGEALGKGIELRRILDWNSDGTPKQDAGGWQQERYGIFLLGPNGVPTLMLLSGTQADPNTGALLAATATLGGASDYAAFDSTGHLTFAGNGRPWRDELTDALSLQQSGAGVARNPTEGTVDFAHNAVYHATFTSADALYCNIQLNHDKDLTASIYAHIHWWQAANYAPNFLLEHRWQVNGGLKTTAWTKLKCNALAHSYSSGTLNQISYAAALAVPVGTTLSDILQFRIYRDTGNASGEFTGTCPYNTGGNRTASVLAFDVHFMLNSLGSTDEYTK